MRTIKMNSKITPMTETTIKRAGLLVADVNNCENVEIPQSCEDF
ncbi:MAG: hypothetical protein V3R77_10340 [Candidatus Binatia bacterium]